MNIREASEDITKWRNSLPSPNIIFKEENTKKYEEISKNSL